MIRSVEPRDSEAIAEIYNHYVEETQTHFEEEPETGDKSGSWGDVGSWALLFRGGEHPLTGRGSDV